MKSVKETRRLAQLLKTLLEEVGIAAKTASRELGYFPDYLYRAFKGHKPLKVRTVFGVLEIARTHPRWFFRRHYSLPKGAPERTGDGNAVARLDALIEAARPPHTPEEWTELTRLLLRRELPLQGKLQNDVGQALGLSEAALGHVLRGETDVTTDHLFGILEVVGTSPPHFFAELTATERRLTTIQLPEDVRRLAKTLAKIRGTDLSTVLEEGFEHLWRSLPEEEWRRVQMVLEAYRKVRELGLGD